MMQAMKSLERKGYYGHPPREDLVFTQILAPKGAPRWLRVPSASNYVGVRIHFSEIESILEEDGASRPLTNETPEERRERVGAWFIRVLESQEEEQSAERVYREALRYFQLHGRFVRYGKGKDTYGIWAGFALHRKESIRELLQAVTIIHEGSTVWLYDLEAQKPDRVLTLWELIQPTWFGEIGGQRVEADKIHAGFGPVPIFFVDAEEKKLWPLSEEQWNEGIWPSEASGGPPAAHYGMEGSGNLSSMRSSMKSLAEDVAYFETIYAIAPRFSPEWMRIKPSREGVLEYLKKTIWAGMISQRGGSSKVEPIDFTQPHYQQEIDWRLERGFVEVDVNPELDEMDEEAKAGGYWGSWRNLILHPRVAKGKNDPDVWSYEHRQKSLGFDSIEIRHKGSAVWWTDLNSGPVRRATLLDLMEQKQPLKHQVGRSVTKMVAEKDYETYVDLWLLSEAQWEGDEDWPLPIEGGPPYHAGASKASEGRRRRAFRRAGEGNNADARRIGDALGVDWKKVDFGQFERGLEVELEHLDVTHGDPIETGKIVLAHLKEDPRYYTKLDSLALEAGEKMAAGRMAADHPTVDGALLVAVDKFRAKMMVDGKDGLPVVFTPNYGARQAEFMADPYRLSWYEGPNYDRKLKRPQFWEKRALFEKGGWYHWPEEYKKVGSLPSEARSIVLAEGIRQRGASEASDVPASIDLRESSCGCDGASAKEEDRGHSPGEFRELIWDLQHQGWRVEQTKQGHYKAFPPDPSQPMVLFSTNPNAKKKVLSQLRRSGYRDMQRAAEEQPQMLQLPAQRRQRRNWRMGVVEDAMRTGSIAELSAMYEDAEGNDLRSWDQTLAYYDVSTLEALRKMATDWEDVRPNFAEKLDELIGLQRDVQEPIGRRTAKENPIEVSDDGIPWIKMERDPVEYEKAIDAARLFGPIDGPEKIYDLLKRFMARQDQEVFCVVGIDVRGHCRGVVEVHRGQRSRVGVSVIDIMNAVREARAEIFVVVHNHPSGEADPSDADEDLTRAITDATKVLGGASFQSPPEKNDPAEVVFGDHVVIGLGQFYSFNHQKLFEVEKKEEES